MGEDGGVHWAGVSAHGLKLLGEGTRSEPSKVPGLQPGWDCGIIKRPHAAVTAKGLFQPGKYRNPTEPTPSDSVWE